MSKVLNQFLCLNYFKSLSSHSKTVSTFFSDHTHLCEGKNCFTNFQVTHWIQIILVFWFTDVSDVAASPTPRISTPTACPRLELVNSMMISTLLVTWDTWVTWVTTPPGDTTTTLLSLSTTGTRCSPVSSVERFLWQATSAAVLCNFSIKLKCKTLHSVWCYLEPHFVKFCSVSCELSGCEHCIVGIFSCRKYCCSWLLHLQLLKGLLTFRANIHAAERCLVEDKLFLLSAIKLQSLKGRKNHLFSR